LAEFEWDAAAQCNIYMSVRRHFNSTCAPTEIVQFTKFVNEQLDDFFTKWEPPTPRLFSDYPIAAFSDQPAKLKAYA